MLGEETVIFVRRCPECSAVYEGESLTFLYADGVHRYCSCGGSLVEGVEPEAGRHYRLVIPDQLRGTSLHRRLEDRLSGDERVEVVAGGLNDRHINLFNCAG